MYPADLESPIREGYFTTVAQADRAIRCLLAAGLSKNEIVVICPAYLKSQLTPEIRDAKLPGTNAPQAILKGGAVGAALGGIALTVTGLVSGGLGFMAAIPILIGGGAIAGGFSALIAADGYGKEIGEHYEEAIRLGKIVVGVKVPGEDGAWKLPKAEAILREQLTDEPEVSDHHGS